MEPDYQSRLSRLRRRLKVETLDGIVVSALVNIRYLTGFTGSHALLLVTESKALIVTDARYAQRVEDEVSSSGVEFEISSGTKELDALKSIVSGANHIGFEALRLSWSNWSAMTRAWNDVELVPTEWVVESIRAEKDDYERSLIEQCAATADAALADVCSMLGQSVSEIDLARALEDRMRHYGADGIAFDTIVASGANAAKPHHLTSDHFVDVNEMVIFDFGAEINGYRSDTSRTYCLGTPTKEQRSVHHLVVEAQAQALEHVRAGRTCGEIHDIAMSVLDRAGMAHLMPHGLGHGVGLEYHEVPWISSSRDHVLQVGEVITLEPGLYLPGLMGVRIEDTVAVTADGCTNFSKASKLLNPL